LTENSNHYQEKTACCWTLVVQTCRIN